MCITRMVLLALVVLQMCVTRMVLLALVLLQMCITQVVLLAMVEKETVKRLKDGIRC